jgi:hypothetical protein
MKADLSVRESLYVVIGAAGLVIIMASSVASAMLNQWFYKDKEFGYVKMLFADRIVQTSVQED